MLYVFVTGLSVRACCVDRAFVCIVSLFVVFAVCVFVCFV